jgi:hypothetical protein
MAPSSDEYDTHVGGELQARYLSGNSGDHPFESAYLLHLMLIEGYRESYHFVPLGRPF